MGTNLNNNISRKNLFKNKMINMKKSMLVFFAVFVMTMMAMSCSLSGRRTCDNCGGSGLETCPKCEGKKQVKCLECRGIGSVKDMFNGNTYKCYDCQGTGYVECRTCEGKGKWRCTHCAGHGVKLPTRVGSSW